MKNIKGQEIKSLAQVHVVTTEQKKHNSNTGYCDIQVHAPDFLPNSVTLNYIAANTSVHIPVYLYTWVCVMCTIFRNKSVEII